MRRAKITQRARRDDTRGIDGAMALIVVTLDVLKVHGRCDSWPLVNVTDVRGEV